MKNLLYILVFLIFMVPTHRVVACENSSNKANIEQTSCNPKKEMSTSKSSCCDSHSKNKEKDCNGGCKDHNCQCSITASITLLAHPFYIKTISILNVEKTYWFFIQKAPKYVYFPIWQPPKISSLV